MLPAGYRFEFGGQFEHLVQPRRRLMVVVPKALVPKALAPPRRACDPCS